MTEVVSLLVTLIVLCVSMATQPTRARCPADWYVNGIRPTGSFECRRAPGGNPDHDGTSGRPDMTIDLPGVVLGRIYCTGGAHPVVVNERAVGCQR